MPLKQVVFQRRGVVLIGGVLHQLPDVGVYPLDSRVLDVHHIDFSGGSFLTLVVVVVVVVVVM